MNKSKVISLLKNPASIGEDDTRELREIINDFPASPILHWLYLKGLQNQKSYLFNSALSRTAIASPDRRQLLKWVGLADDENSKKQKFEFKIPEDKEVIVPVKTEEIVEPKAIEIIEPKVVTPPKPKPEPVKKKEAELPDEILALLEKSKRIRDGYHGVNTTIEEEKTIEETPKPSIKTPEPEIIPEPIIENTSTPPPFETTLTKEKEPEEITEIFDVGLDNEKTELQEATEVNEPQPVSTSFEIVLESYDESEEESPINEEPESVIISLDENPSEWVEKESADFTSWLKGLNDKSEINPKATEEIPESKKIPIQEMSFEIEPENIQPSPTKTTNKAKAHKIELIDKFLEVKPKIKPTRDSIGGMPVPETVHVDDNQFITETLAQIYVEQGHYNRAIEAFEILGLKYPEKNSFFADQIREIKRRK